MEDAELHRRLTDIYRTLELIAFLLAALLLGEGSVGFVVGGVTMLLLIADAISRALGLGST